MDGIAGNTPWAREGHALAAIIPGGAARRRRRRLLSAAEPFDPPPVKKVEVRSAGDTSRFRPTEAPSYELLMFGGATERGLVASAQDMSTSLY